jgi:hypothetical protein
MLSGLFAHAEVGEDGIEQVFANHLACDLPQGCHRLREVYSHEVIGKLLGQGGPSSLDRGLRLLEKGLVARVADQGCLRGQYPSREDQLHEGLFQLGQALSREC